MSDVVRATEDTITEAISWMVARGMPAPPRDIFSSAGWCVPGVAAWWLYLTDSSLAWTEMLCSNPKVGKERRSAAFDAVIAHVLTEARAAGTRILMCNIDRDDLEARALKHGYQVMGRNMVLMGATLMGGA